MRRMVVVIAASLVLALADGRAQEPGAVSGTPAQPTLGSRGVPIVEVGALRFRDLNRSGQLEPYEDWRLPGARRVADLVSRMTLEEKAGVMMHGTAPGSRGVIGIGGSYDLAGAEKIILGAYVNSLISRLSGEAAALAGQNNALQGIAERSRLGIPLTISTDPRHHFQNTLGASVAAGGFTQWPETLGMAALRDPALVRRFADIARREYRAVGIHMALSPQADLATEPRWGRTSGTFGEDPELVRDLVAAYVEGFQGGAGGLRQDGVLCIVKHWVGYGAAVGGYDGHNHYGRFGRLDGALGLHVRAFEGAFAAKVAGIMPTYTVLQDVTIDGRPIEQVGGGFNQQLLGPMLRERYAFDGMILSDWAITRVCGENCRTGATPHTFGDIAMPWGVESLSVPERFVKGVQAGLDQFGGTEESPVLVEAVRRGALTEARLDESVARILGQKFELGLFENPFVDPASAATLVGAAGSRAEADVAQRRAQVLLEDRTGVLPLKRGAKVYLHGIAPAAARARGLRPVMRLEQADVAVLRVSAPHELEHPNHFFGRLIREGRLDFRDGDADYEQIKAAAARVPTVVSVYLDRPAVLANVRDKAAALLGNFGASDEAMLDVVTGRAKAEGRLPFALPASMEDVVAQSPGRAHDIPAPLYPFGAGLGMAAVAPSAWVEPAELPAYNSAVLRVLIRPGRALGPGAVVSTQLPSAMLADEQSYSLTKDVKPRPPDSALQVPALPAGAPPAAAPPPAFAAFTRWNTVTAEVPGYADVTFEVTVEKREFEIGQASSRHGQVAHAKVTAGTVPAGMPVVVTYRTSTPWVASDRYRVYVAIDGERITPDPSFAIVAGPAAKHRVIVPSSARPGEPFRVLLISLDRYDNLATSRVAGVRLTVGDEVLREKIAYTGRHETQVSLPREGVYRLSANGMTSNPIRITGTPQGPYWGDIHNHNEADHDAAAGGNSAVYARDVSGLDFFSLSNHANGGFPVYRERAQRLCREFDEPGRFVSLLAFETGVPPGYHSVATFADCETPVPAAMLKGSRSLSRDEYAAYLEGKDVVTAVHHTGVIWAANDFAENRAFFPSTRLFEIYSSHGQSEQFDTTGPLAYEQQVSAPFSLSRRGAFYARDAWALGHRLVTVASSDDHNGQPGKPHNGLTAVFAPRLDRSAIHEALRGGTTYGTTGERILLAFSANGAAMGSAVIVPKGAALAFRMQVHGTGPLDKVEVFRHVASGSNGWETVFSRTGIGDLDFEREWSEPSPGPAVYYARVTQATAHDVYVPVYQRRPAIAWSSPIWIEAPAR